MFKKLQSQKKSSKKITYNSQVIYNSQESPNIDSNIDAKDLLDYYWKYFDLQSHQRNLLCQFYITLIIALFSAFMYTWEHRIIWAVYVVLILTIIIAIIFYFTFKRSTKLRNMARQYLANFERKYISDEKENPLSHEVKEKKFFSYTNLFIFQLFLFGFAALFAMYCIHKGWLKPQ